MSNKMYIIEVAPEAIPSLDKEAKFNGAIFAKYCLVTINEKTNKLKTRAYMGDVLTCISKGIAESGMPIELTNFGLSVVMPNGSTKKMVGVLESSLAALKMAKEVKVVGDGINSLARLKSSQAVAVASIKIAGKNLDYGCLLFGRDGTCKPIGWNVIEKNIRAGKLVVHNITKEGNDIVRTNISKLGVVMMSMPQVEKPAAAPESKPARPVEKTDIDTVQKSKAEEAKKKKKILDDLFNSKSPLAYFLSDEYSLDTMQYILAIKAQGEEVSYMLNPKYNIVQLHALYRAYNMDIDVSIIADPNLPAKYMDDIIKRFEYGIWDNLEFVF